MRRALEDPHLLGTMLPGESWAGWRVLLIAAMGEELTDAERAVFRELTGREEEPGEPVEEFWAVVGRRGGKTRSAAVLAAYLAALTDYSDALAPGERGVLPIMAASKQQANKALSYISGVFAHIPAFARLKVNETAESISLSNSIDIEVRPTSYRTIRGITAIAAIGDEVAYWRSEDTANPDTEILAAVRPSLLPGSILVVISSPHARRGEVYETHRQHYGPAGDPLILVAQGSSRQLNPSLSQRIIDRAYERDPSRASAEYGAAFRDDLESLVARETVVACVAPGVYERPSCGSGHFAFTDPSGGSADSFSLAIGHREGDRAVLDAVREVTPPFSPDDTVQEFAKLLRSYGLTRVTGDRYAGMWPRERFKIHGIHYQVAERNKSELYQDMLPLLNSRRCDLLDNKRLVTQLVGLERRTSRGGRDTIDHAPGGHDDVANSVAGCLVGLTARQAVPVARWGVYQTLR